MDFSKLQLKDIAVSQKGAKSAAAVLENGEKLVWTCPEKIVTPWGATTFGDEQQVRRTIEFSLSTPALQECFKRFDDWAVKYLATCECPKSPNSEAQLALTSVSFGVNRPSNPLRQRPSPTQYRPLAVG